MSNIVEKIFEKELTKKGLEELKVKYPADLKLDMKDDATFKEARKTRTEMNKLLGQIKERRIEITGQLKSHADAISSEVENIYSVVVDPFLVEDKRRKDLAEKDKRERDELLAKEGKKIKEIKGFVDSAQNMDSEGIQGLIEAVDLIEVDQFDKELIHEAIEVKKETLSSLASLLVAAQAGEALESERKKVRIQERINKLKMIPVDMTGKSPDEIRLKMEQIESVELKEEDFEDSLNEAKDSVVTVLSQLNAILMNAEELEKMREQQQDEEVPAPEVEIETESDDIDKVVDEATQELIEAVKQGDEEKAAESVEKLAGDEKEAPTLRGDIDSWAKDFGISSAATKALMAVISQYVETE